MKRPFGVVVFACGLAACAPRELIYPLVGQDVPRLREFPEDFIPPLSNETGEPVGGFGGGGGGGSERGIPAASPHSGVVPSGVQRTPVIFVHGNTVSADYWLPVRERFKAAGYTDDELWALSYGWNSVRAFDGNDLSVPTLEAFVAKVQAYLSKKAGRPIRQFDVIGHSLGVTLVRQWMKQHNRYHSVRNFIGACGANDGVWTARMDTRGQNRVVSFELAPGSPWLAQLNRGGETPGPTRYMTLYDGTGWGDVLFPKPSEHSSALEGATNLAFNVEHGTHYDHLELPRMPETIDAMLGFLREAGEPSPTATPPTIVRDGDVLRPGTEGAQLHCAADGALPTREGAIPELDLQASTVQTCYAFDPRTGLASPMRHFTATAAASAAPLTLEATPAGGTFEQPVSVTLKSSDPAAHIVYTTGGGTAGEGSPLYSAPIYVAGPLTLSAMAVAPDGRKSAPVRLEFDISLELVDANRSLERQLNPDAPAVYRGKRKRGN